MDDISDFERNHSYKSLFRKENISIYIDNLNLHHIRFEYNKFQYYYLQRTSDSRLVLFERCNQKAKPWMSLNDSWNKSIAINNANDIYRITGFPFTDTMMDEWISIILMEGIANG